MNLPNFTKLHLVQYQYDVDNKVVHQNPKVVFKFGYTKDADASRRHTIKYHKERNFKFTAMEEDYQIITLWSAWFDTKEIAMAVENQLLTMFPFKNCYTDTQYNGVTELRAFNNSEGEMVNKMLRSVCPKPLYSFRPDGYKVYFIKFVAKESPFETSQDTNTTQSSIF